MLLYNRVTAERLCLRGRVMKKRYVEPEINVVDIEVEDIICDSNEYPDFPNS